MHKEINSNFKYEFVQALIVTFVIYLTVFYSYPLFHSLAEIVCVVIGFGVYMIAWNSRRFADNKYFVFLGIAFAFITTFDLLHTFSYQGLDIFIYAPGSNLATQLWLAARYFQSFSFLVATFFIGKELKIPRVFFFYSLTFLIVSASIVLWPVFPVTYIEGYGLTTFKKGSEIIICLFYLAAIFFTYRKKEFFNKQVFELIIGALIVSIVSEIMSMAYTDIYDYFNIIGHLMKVISYGLIYLALIEMGLRKPYAILFKSLKDSEVKHISSEEKFRTIFNNTTVGILMTDLKGQIIESNNHFIEKIGYSIDELLVLTLPELNRLFNNNFDSKKFKEIKKGKINYYEFENCYHKKNGKVLWGDTSVSLIKNNRNQPQYILWVIDDVTQAKEIEKNKLEFISLASHQLRTPLTSIRLATELLLRGTGGVIDNRQNRYLQEINDATKIMSDMVKDLLNVSRVELGTFVTKLEPINLVNNLNQLIEELSLIIKSKHLQIIKIYSPNLPIIIIFDYQVLKIIFENLLTNAICYTPNHGQITIELKPAANNILFSIADTGCGIPNSDKRLVFNKLFRSNVAKEINPNGTGLGLYIVKSIAKKAKARVWLESQEGEGSTFYVSIPINK